jgi:hypothetical protein
MQAMGSTGSKHARAGARAAVCSGPLWRMRVSEVRRVPLAVAELDRVPTPDRPRVAQPIDPQFAHRLGLSITYQQGVV